MLKVGAKTPGPRRAAWANTQPTAAPIRSDSPEADGEYAAPRLQTNFSDVLAQALEKADFVVGMFSEIIGSQAIQSI